MSSRELSEALDAAMAALFSYDSVGSSRVEREARALALDGVEAALKHLQEAPEVKCACGHRRAEHYGDDSECYRDDCSCRKFKAK